MLQALAARNTYDLKFRSDAARVKGVSCLKGAEGLTVTPYDRSVAVTVLYLNFEVDQRLVARVLSQYGTVSDMRWCKYGSGELAGIFNGKRQCRMELDRDIPSFLFIGGSKAHIRYFGQPRTCFKCGQEGHEARSCPNRRCGKCLQVGHDKAECPNEVRCNLCGEEGHVSGACPTSYSARASADVEQAPQPSQAGPEYSTECEGGTVAPKADSSPSSPPTPVEADRMAVEEDLQLSSDSESAMSDGESWPTGRGFWKMNTDILTEADYSEQFKARYEGWRTLKPAFSTDLEWWDDVKSRIKQFTVECCVARARRKREEFLSLCFRERDGDSSALHGIQQYLDEKLRGARVRARVHCVEAEEKPTIKFYRDVTKYAIDRRIRAVRDVHGTVQKDPLDIVEVFKTFYEQLYTRADVEVDLQGSLLDNIDKTPSKEQNDGLGSPLTVDELWKAVAKMKGGKAPGSDGIPVEFYKRFWGTVGHDLRDVFASAFLAGSLSPSQRTGVITLLPKSGDPLEPKNKRPITLLNVDYKILAKALCNRLGTVMPDLVGSFQTCAVRGHSIQQNLWLMRDLVEYVMDRDLPCALVSLDQEKAFDMVDHGFLFKILKKFNLNPVFVKWTSLLYNSVYSRVIVNGLPSDAFRVHRGVRQGCPLSPLLYVLFSESLARAFQVEPLFRPFHIPGGAKVKCLQYADDVTCVVSDLASFRALTGTLSTFQRATGARLNPTKTKGLRLGKWRSKQLPFAASWVDDAIKINGIWFGYGSPESLTWNEKVDLVEARLKDFGDRKISLLGKVTVINRFVYPLLWYPGTVLAAPEGVLVRLERAVFRFLWSGKTELVRRKVVYQVPRQGGLGLVHFPSKLRFLLTKCVFSAVESQMPFAYFVRYWGGLSFRWFFPTLFSNSVPHSWRPTKAYCQMRETLRIMSTVGNVLQSSAGDQYRAIFDDLVGQVQPNDYASGPEVWRVVYSGTLDHRRRDLLWRIAHDAIVTNLKRLRWRLGDGICPRTGCTGWESVPHVFWQCGFVALLWEWFQALADRLTFCNTWAVSQDYALYGLSPPPCNTSVRGILTFVSASIKLALWRDRCNIVFRGEGGLRTSSWRR
ncbi:hypothetical protein HOLleu_43604 [Holothuria leucospilota]|uniref:Reverse transcriptase n=1 Tax=Holothuria leucospilota TaxID=206669 RepID=A0A9Q0YGS7_HOLLE|nr:hypothetical protein HOLleu_43604 [Holothuria leucospilota]